MISDNTKLNTLRGILSVVLLCAVIAMVLTSCQGYQPPGQDLWLTVR